MAVTATTLIGELADRVEGASRAWTAGLVTVAAPAANAIPNATIAADTITNRFRRDMPIAYGSADAL